MATDLICDTVSFIRRQKIAVCRRGEGHSSADDADVADGEIDLTVSGSGARIHPGSDARPKRPFHLYDGEPRRCQRTRGTGSVRERIRPAVAVEASQGRTSPTGTRAGRKEPTLAVGDRDGERDELARQGVRQKRNVGDR